MALTFSNQKGKAQKGNEAYTYKDGENVVRIFGGILPRYVYWLKGENNKDLPVECLAFSREEEKFNNRAADCVQEYFPDAKCSWSYVVNCIDPKDGKAKVLNLKKKLWEQVCSAAGDLNLDPTDPDNGFDLIFKRTKTGALAFNVEYTLSQLKLKPRALTEAERAVVAECPTIDEKFPKPTTAEIRKLMEKLKSGASEDSVEEDGVDGEAVNELS